MEIGNIKKNAIAMQKKIILDLRENFGSESSRENAVEKLNQIVDDYEKDNNSVDAKNIHLYYEFMTNNDKFMLANANKIENAPLTQILVERGSQLNKYFKFTSISDKLNNVKTIDYESNFSKKQVTIGMLYFGVKDTLKPIDEFIDEIENSDEYKKYVSENFDNLIKLYDSKESLTSEVVTTFKTENNEYHVIYRINGDDKFLDVSKYDKEFGDYNIDNDELFNTKFEVKVESLEKIKILIDNYENSLINDTSLEEAKKLVVEHNSSSFKLQPK